MHLALGVNESTDLDSVDWFSHSDCSLFFSSFSFTSPIIPRVVPAAKESI